MKAFFVGLALGFGIGILLLPRNNDEREQLLRERTRELQRSVPDTKERELQSAAIQERDRFTVPRIPGYGSRAGARRVGIHPIVLLNMATEQELLSAGVEPQEASRILARRPFTSLQDAVNREVSPSTLALIEKAAHAHEPLPVQPMA